MRGSRNSRSFEKANVAGNFPASHLGERSQDIQAAVLIKIQRQFRSIRPLACHFQGEMHECLEKAIVDSARGNWFLRSRYPLNLEIISASVSPLPKTLQKKVPRHAAFPASAIPSRWTSPIMMVGHPCGMVRVSKGGPA